MQQSQILSLLNELEQYQKKRLMQVAEEYIPDITDDDILQPNDFPVLENNPIFRYEEGVLHGVRLTISAIQASLKESS